MKQKIFHTINPVFNKNSRVLILGTIPSPKSREVGFYYSHPKNRFWLVLSILLNKKLPLLIEDKKNLLLDNNVALWDVLKSCSIDGANDSSISDPVPNDLSIIIKNSNIKNIFTTGIKATMLYKKYCLKDILIQSTYLKSTSPANCKESIQNLIEDYKKILIYI